MEIYRAIYTHAQEILIREGRMREIMAMEILAEIMVKRVVEIVAEIVEERQWRERERYTK